MRYSLSDHLKIISRLKPIYLFKVLSWHLETITCEPIQRRDREQKNKRTNKIIIYTVRRDEYVRRKYNGISQEVCRDLTVLEGPDHLYVSLYFSLRSGLWIHRVQVFWTFLFSQFYCFVFFHINYIGTIIWKNIVIILFLVFLLM